MTEIFALWNPFKCSDMTYEFDATQADVFSIKYGTKSWVNECLNRLEIKGDPVEWEIDLFRSVYFSDYPESEDWEERWEKVWRLRVLTNIDDPSFTNKLLHVPEFIDLPDTSSSEEEEDELVCSVLILADFKEDLKKKESHYFQIAKDISELPTLQLKKIDFSLRLLQDDIFQFRLVIGGIRFPADLRAIDSILHILEDKGGFTNWRDRIDWIEAENSSKVSQGIED